jgi:hypothetical protein
VSRPHARHPALCCCGAPGYEESYCDCHIIETGTAEIKAGTSQVSDYSHREA